MKKITLFLAAAFAFSHGFAANKTVELFNGADLSNWSFFLDPSKNADAKDVFFVKDGLINIKGQPFGYMYTKNRYDNFRLHVEWRWTKTLSNSGIFVLTQDEAFWANCIEIQLRAGSAGDFVLMGGADMKEYKLPESGVRPQFPVLGRFGKSNENPLGEWNNADIVCKDGVVEVYINGTLQNRGTSAKHKSGHIALQSEGDEVQFRNVRLTPMD
jgi:hypothetical protein